MPTIVLVEDDQFLGGLIAEKLGKEGYKVVRALDGNEGVAKTKEARPDLVLLDIILPGLNGFDVIQKLKEDPQTNAIPVVMLTNLGQREDVDKAMALGARDYLIKAHFTPSEIIEKVASLVGKPSAFAPAPPADAASSAS